MVFLQLSGQFSTMHFIVNICIIGTIISIVFTAEIGDQCFLRNESIGVCQLLPSCKSALDGLKRRIIPVHCGFFGKTPIVCCKDEKSSFKNYKSEEKCLEYSNLDIRTTITTTTTTPRPTPIDGNTVFVAAVGGVDAQHEEFPHMALLGYGSSGNIEFQCGGSLISEQFVLTAAHCLESRELGPVSLVVLGDLDIAVDFDRAEPQNFSIIQTIPHPNYDFENFYNDIALLKLDRPVIYTRYVKPACIQSKFELEGNDLTATGWGALEFGDKLHSILQKVELKSLPVKNCLPTYGPQHKLPQGFNETIQICGGNLEKRMDTCQGDSGGPLQLKIKDFPLTHKVVGVTSFGTNCGLVPGVYTRISYYINWIESIVWPN